MSYVFNNATFTNRIGNDNGLDMLWDAVSKYDDKFISIEEYCEITGIEYSENIDCYKEFGSEYFSFNVQNDCDGLCIFGGSGKSQMSEFFKKICDRFNLDVECEFEDSDASFGGFYQYKNGEVVRDSEFTYNQYLYMNALFYGSVFSDLFTDFESFDEVIDGYADVISIAGDDEKNLREFLFKMYNESR
jgi:hypothetical protein